MKDDLLKKIKFIKESDLLNEKGLEIINICEGILNNANSKESEYNMVNTTIDQIMISLDLTLPVDDNFTNEDINNLLDKVDQDELEIKDVLDTIKPVSNNDPIEIIDDTNNYMDISFIEETPNFKKLLELLEVNTEETLRIDEN